EDAAQALGASIKNKRVGSFGDIGIFSFNKFLNVNLGGAVTTNDDELASKIKLIRTKYEDKSILASLGYSIMELFGLKSRKFMKMIFLSDKYLYSLAVKIFRRVEVSFKSFCFNDRTSDEVNQLMSYDGRYYHRRKMEKIELLVLQSEFRTLEKVLEKRREIAKIYEERIKKGNVNKIITKEDYVPSFFKYPVLFFDRDKLTKCIKNMVKAGFVVNYRYKPLHTSFSTTNHNSVFRESTYVSNHILPLPVEPNLTVRHIERIISIINSD
ncbi:MAG: DegT/DnrJ/EryC1/StrS family aminotransferase, partial [Candidatus Baldrarchaeia archaeon]